MYRIAVRIAIGFFKTLHGHAFDNAAADYFGDSLFDGNDFVEEAP